MIRYKYLKQSHLEPVKLILDLNNSEIVASSIHSYEGCLRVKTFTCNGEPTTTKNTYLTVPAI